MPFTLVPPAADRRTPFYTVRGTYRGVYRNRSAKTGVERKAQEFLKSLEREIDEQLKRGEPAGPSGPVSAAGFAAAATSYMKAGGEALYLAPLIEHFGNRPLAQITQLVIDNAADELYPDATAATRNRQVYTPISAVLKRAGIERKVYRPKGHEGKKSTSWLEPDEAFALLAAADSIDPEFGLLCRTFLYTGLRESELLSRKVRDLKLARSFLYLDDSKNGDPRGVHLPAHLVAAFHALPPRKLRPPGTPGNQLEDAGVPWLERRLDAKLFRFHKGGALYDRLYEAMRIARLSFPKGQSGFHLFCHTYGTWMHVYGKLDTEGLTRTKRWRNPKSAARYMHTDASPEAQRADLLPVPGVTTTKRQRA